MTFSFRQDVLDNQPDLQEQLRKADILDHIYNNLVLPEEIKIRIFSDRTGEPYISEHSAYSDYFIECEANTLQDAFTAKSKMQPLKIFKCRDGFCSFRPETHLKDKRNDFTGKGEYIGDCIYKVKGLNFRDEKQFVFFIRFEELTLEMRIIVENDDETRRTARVKEYMGGTLIEDCRVHYNHEIFTDHICWGRGSNNTMNDFTIYGAKTNEETITA